MCRPGAAEARVRAGGRAVADPEVDPILSKINRTAVQRLRLAPRHATVARRFNSTVDRPASSDPFRPRILRMCESRVPPPPALRLSAQGRARPGRAGLADDPNQIIILKIIGCRFPGILRTAAEAHAYSNNDEYQKAYASMLKLKSQASQVGFD